MTRKPRRRSNRPKNSAETNGPSNTESGQPEPSTVTPIRRRPVLLRALLVIFGLWLLLLIYLAIRVNS